MITIYKIKIALLNIYSILDLTKFKVLYNITISYNYNILLLWEVNLPNKVIESYKYYYP